ncbi:hypothetical protein JOL79_13570 [Microbispora sp. RL4-1S]|uniref:Uncharacterized protein n=1 Tax=Microbispora oryzae TaxID=2806554 RepID=A0A940WQ34_9ACTN|nr:hypothetical protein [Microbispora oryzae]MBP2704844.1 hypothetical protein [Microbispora oryzae]
MRGKDSGSEQERERAETREGSGADGSVTPPLPPPSFGQSSGMPPEDLEATGRFRAVPPAATPSPYGGAGRDATTAHVPGQPGPGGQPAPAYEGGGGPWPAQPVPRPYGGAAWPPGPSADPGTGVAWQPPTPDPGTGVAWQPPAPDPGTGVAWPHAPGPDFGPGAGTAWPGPSQPDPAAGTAWPAPTQPDPGSGTAWPQPPASGQAPPPPAYTGPAPGAEDTPPPAVEPIEPRPWVPPVQAAPETSWQTPAGPPPRHLGEPGPPPYRPGSYDPGSGQWPPAPAAGAWPGPEAPGRHGMAPNGDPAPPWSAPAPPAPPWAAPPAPPAPDGPHMPPAPHMPSAPDATAPARFVNWSATAAPGAPAMPPDSPMSPVPSVPPGAEAAPPNAQPPLEPGDRFVWPPRLPGEDESPDRPPAVGSSWPPPAAYARDGDAPGDPAAALGPAPTGGVAAPDGGETAGSATYGPDAEGGAMGATGRAEGRHALTPPETRPETQPETRPETLSEAPSAAYSDALPRAGSETAPVTAPEAFSHGRSDPMLAATPPEGLPLPGGHPASSLDQFPSPDLPGAAPAFDTTPTATYGTGPAPSGAPGQIEHPAGPATPQSVAPQSPEPQSPERQSAEQQSAEQQSMDPHSVHPPTVNPPSPDAPVQDGPVAWPVSPDTPAGQMPPNSPAAGSASPTTQRSGSTPFAFTPVTPARAGRPSPPSGIDVTPQGDTTAQLPSPSGSSAALPVPLRVERPAAGGGAGGGTVRRVLLAVCSVIVVAAIGTAAYYAYSEDPDQTASNGTSAAGGGAPAPAGPQASVPPSTVLDSERTDPRKMTPAEAFPETKVTVAGRTYRRVKVEVVGSCGKSATGAFAGALDQQQCRQVLRATYVDGKHDYAVTTGIAVMPTKQAALTVDRAKDLAGNVWFRGMNAPKSTGADRVAISGGYAAGMVWGRYIVFSYATYADGHTPEAKDKSLAPISGGFRDQTAKVIEKRVKK